MKLLIIFISLGYLNWIGCFDKQAPKCEDNKECGKCIGFAANKCVWCSKVNITTRCKTENYYLYNSKKDGAEQWCDKDHISKATYELTFPQNGTFSETIQLLPQYIKIKSRPGETVKFQMSYKPAKHFPLDVYFLMDYSYTMKTYKTVLKNQVKNIYTALKNMTNNVYLGVGSFIEKPGFPYADVMADFDHRHYAYAFKNHLSLTDNMTNFEDVIEKSRFGSNYEDPESSLDALLQVMACEKEIKWRNDTRRIIVLATDATYHSAGDGKMIGAVKPNDMACRMKNNEYDRNASLIYDYPSVSQINKLANDGKFTIIYAALSKVEEVYTTLSPHIWGSKYAELKNVSASNSDNIVQIIENAYKESVENVELDFQEDPIIKLDLDCTRKTSSDKCKITTNQTTVYISGTITALECPPKGAPSTYTIDIKHLRINDYLTIEFEIDCQCECEKNVTKVLSEECNNHGVKQCGSCKCNKDRSGDKCELDCAITRDYTKCYFNPDSIHPCSGHGNCECGSICKCNPDYSGQFCQYNNLACPKPNNYLCSGHGECNFEKCVCHSLWTGEGCECSLDTSRCIGAFSKKVCSGRGECNCGRCDCHKIEGTHRQYLGAYCDSCDQCAQERCDELKDYVHCNYREEKEQCDVKFHQDININIKITRLKKSIFNSTEMLAIKCETELDDGQILVFKYDAVSDTKQLHVIIQEELEPAPKVDMWMIIGSVVGGILLAGILALIVWKIVIDKYDAREYEKFCDSARAQGYDVSQNPLYQRPNINFNNPMFHSDD